MPNCFEDDNSQTGDSIIGSSLRERLRTQTVFTKDQCFYLNYHKFSIKSYVLDVYWNRLSEAILIHIHNIRFYEEILKIIHFYHFDSDPRFPPFLLYVRWKSGVTFVRRCFRDVMKTIGVMFDNAVNTCFFCDAIMHIFARNND